jgi:DNA-binding MarR family transcriptional regulator
MLETVCVCNKARRAARAVTRLYDQALEPAGITVTQYSLLRMLLRVGEQPITAVAEATGLDRTTLARNLRALEKEGLVAFEPGRDRRERHIAVTAVGRRRVERATPRWEAVQAQIRGALGEQEYAHLFALLGRLERMAAA